MTVAGIAAYVRPEADQLAAKHGLSIEDELRPVIAHAAEVLHSPKTTVVIQVNAASAIYEIAVGGRTHPQRGSVLISLADVLDDEKERRAIAVWLPQTVAHELDHSARILDGPGYGTTLRDAMISEGLADQFAQSLLPQTPVPPWTEALSATQAEELWRRAQPLLGQSSLATNRAWLFGSADVPRWTAYTLGSRIVAAHRQRRPDQSWADLTREKSADILRESHYPAAS